LVKRLIILRERATSVEIGEHIVGAATVRESREGEGALCRPLGGRTTTLKEGNIGEWAKC